MRSCEPTHDRTGYPLMGDDERALITLAGTTPSCATCAWSQGGPHGAGGTQDSWRTPRCERRYLHLMDLEYERWGADKTAPYTNDHRPDAACGAGATTTTQWVARWRANVARRDPADPSKHARWWNANYPRLGVGNSPPDHPACIHWHARGTPLPTIAELWATFDRERA